MKKVQIRQSESDYIKLIQITDSHIIAQVEGKFDGMDTGLSLDRVLEYICAQAYAADAVLFTGDLVHEPVKPAYEKLLKKLLRLDVPVFCLAGNHDNPEIMQAVLRHKHVSTAKVLECRHWQILMLNSFLPNSHAGRLASDELEFLQSQLMRSMDKHILICLHHPPVSIGSPWMDVMMLENPDEFFTVVDAYTNVRGIIWGHIHQAFSLERNKVLLMASPSTCVQFLPQTEQYVKDDKMPGYRELTLQANGSINTSIRRLDRHNYTKI